MCGWISFAPFYSWSTCPMYLPIHPSWEIPLELFSLFTICFGCNLPEWFGAFCELGHLAVHYPWSNLTPFPGWFQSARKLLNSIRMSEAGDCEGYCNLPALAIFHSDLCLPSACWSVLYRSDICCLVAFKMLQDFLLSLKKRCCESIGCQITQILPLEVWF